jgi:hypothetical protein
MLNEAVVALLEKNVKAFARSEVDSSLSSRLVDILDRKNLVLCYDPSSEVFAEFASWPLITLGYYVTVVNAHTAQYYLAPYTPPETGYIYFIDDPYRTLSAQLITTIKIMQYPSLLMSVNQTKESDILTFSKEGEDRIMTGVKGVNVLFYNALYKKSSNQRIKRVLGTLLLDEKIIFDYLMNSLKTSQPVKTSKIAAQGPLLSAAKVANLIDASTQCMSTLSLFNSELTSPIELWSSDVDAEVVARLRFEKKNSSYLQVVHFGFDPLSAPILTPYSATLAGLGHNTN